MEHRTTESAKDKPKTQSDSGNFSEDFPRILKIDETKIQDHLGRLVRQSVEETLNGLLEAEADRLCQAGRYVRSPERADTRAGHYKRTLHTKAGEVELKMPKLRSLPFETEIIKRYQRRESSVEEALMEMYLRYMHFPPEHWRSLRTNNPLERIMREIRRRTRVVGSFPDGRSALMLVAARLRHIAGTKWGLRRYMNMDRLKEQEEVTGWQINS